MSFRRNAGLLALGLAVATPLSLLSLAVTSSTAMAQEAAEVSAVPEQPAATAVVLSQDTGPALRGTSGSVIRSGWVALVSLIEMWPRPCKAIIAKAPVDNSAAPAKAAK